MDLRSKVNPDELRKAKVAKIILGLHRMADIVGGKVREYSAREILHARTGNLAREWTLLPVPDDPLALKLKNRSVQARLLEYGSEGLPGGVVVPTKAGALAIPMEGPALTERGVPRFTGPRAAEAAGHHLFVFRAHDAKAYLVEATANGKLEFWYALRASVRIPAFRYATRAVEDSRAAAVKELERAVAE